MPDCANDGALRDIRPLQRGPRVGIDARRRGERRPRAARSRGDRRPRRADRARALHRDGRAADEHGRGHQRHRRHGRGRGGRHRGCDRRRPDGHEPHERRAAVRGKPSVRAVVRAGHHGQDAVPQAHRAHPVVGTQHDDLGHPRACRRRGREQGLPDHQRAGRVPPPPAGAVGIQPLLGRRADGLRLEPRARVPAAADRGPAVAARRLEPVRVLPRRHGPAPA